MLSVNHVSKSFDSAEDSVAVLDDVSLAVAPGERLAIMGPSGSGKSTLLAILGVLEEPSSGSVTLDGVDPFAGSPAQRALFRNRRIGFVFQEHHLLAGCSALDNVLVPALAHGSVTPEIVARGRRLLDHVGLAHRIRHRPGELSGGERQRVAIARALVLSPRLVLADEPTGQLDSTTSLEVTELLVHLTEETGGMLVVVTHAESVAERIGNVRRLIDGRLAP
jgi:lipoprotein-releasing system ATP-binding protein